MAVDSENLRLVLGLKARALRARHGWTLQETAGRAGIAVSYLSEIEKGKKYPKPDRLLALARALGVSFEELVSPRVEEELSPLEAFARSGFLREFPFELFGLAPQDLFGLVAGDTKRAGALLRTFAEIGRRHDLEVGQFLFAALRSYQQLHGNYFPDLEAAAARLRAEEGWSRRTRLEPEPLAECLARRWGYRLDYDTLPARRELAGLRSVYDAGPPPTLHLNGRLRASQRAFVLAREIGYRALGLAARAVTSSWLRAESFEQVLNNFRASYFAGALLIPEAAFGVQLERFFASRRWRPEALAAGLARFGATPEMLFYRVTELTPGRFGLPDLFFVRLQRDADRRRPRLTKVLNLSRVPVPHGVGPDEHYCARWPGVEIFDHPGVGAEDGSSPVLAQRSSFVSEGVEFLVVASARPLALRPATLSSVSLGFLVDERAGRVLRFLDDPAIPRRRVDLTCERCPLPGRECAERSSPASLLERQRALERREAALAELLGRPGA